MSKTLVAYFSVTGSTARLAQAICEVAGADLYEIKPEQAYTVEDLDWRNAESRSSVEMKNSESRVAIGSECVDMTQYDKIMVGYPIWWGVAPHIVNSFLEAYDLTGKTIVPFATSGGSPLGDVQAYLGASCKGAILAEGKRLSAVEEKAVLEAWLN